LKPWIIGFGFLAALSIVMFFNSDSALLKGINAAQFIACVIVLVLVSKNKRSGSNER
jgi:hypothetical protein